MTRSPVPPTDLEYLAKSIFFEMESVALPDQTLHFCPELSIDTLECVHVMMTSSPCALVTKAVETMVVEVTMKETRRCKSWNAHKSYTA
jgi:hypothetical protein